MVRNYWNNKSRKFYNEYPLKLKEVQHDNKCVAYVSQYGMNKFLTITMELSYAIMTRDANNDF